MIDQAYTRDTPSIALKRDAIGMSSGRLPPDSAILPLASPLTANPAPANPSAVHLPAANLPLGASAPSSRPSIEVPAAFAAPAAERPKRMPVDCGLLPFLIKRDGTWLYRGSPIGRKELVCLFSSVLRRAADGHWYMQTPAERGRIEVEDTPFMAVELDWSGDGRDQRLSFRTNVDEVVTAGPDHFIRVAHDLLTCEPTPYLHLRDGDGSYPIEARICRAVYYEMVALAVPHWVGGRQMLGVWSGRTFFSLGEMPAGEADCPVGEADCINQTVGEADCINQAMTS